ncbi:anti-sigma F factor antagonist [Jeotgalibacillus alimentarius]|uniref:Anti-sigma F factor antagonist n=2 Tax=Jeotgalibacillus TaxID=157226 RepID=A0A0C2VYG9_9BACL|nr:MULTISPECIES: anti-sigma F factor antagonist [Jeotgalibacillus]KIL48988.1 anti-sigma F factor antagonist [Jeotgalibacillus alimentarius]MBM7577487.1 stage II sporulation protein AA (anti-sigma F factor antagonist) [Jeotgalibacillus terrae]
MACNVEAEVKGNVLLLRMSGELDHHEVGPIRKELIELMEKESIRHMILNLANLEFMDSSGLGLILGRYKHLQKIGGNMVLCAATPAVKRLFEMSGMYKILIVELSEERAFSRLEAVQ